MAGDSAVGMMARGRTWDSVPSGSLGLNKSFQDTDWGSAQSVKPKLSNSLVKCILVKNETGGALAPCQIVKFKAAGYLTTIGALAGSAEVGDGVVDEYVASVPANAYFWLVRKGPTKLINSGANAWSQGDFAKTAADGKAVEEDTNMHIVAVCGRAMADVAATADLKFRAFVNFEQP